MAKKKDLRQGEDGSGTTALFIEERHFDNNSELDFTTKKFIQKTFTEETYFRVIKNGVIQSGHGWVDSDGDVFQWG